MRKRALRRKAERLSFRSTGHTSRSGGLISDSVPAEMTPGTFLRHRYSCGGLPDCGRHLRGGEHTVSIQYRFGTIQTVCSFFCRKGDMILSKPKGDYVQEEDLK